MCGVRPTTRLTLCSRTCAVPGSPRPRCHRRCPGRSVCSARSPARRHHGHPPAAPGRRHLRREGRHRPRRGYPLPRHLRRRRAIPAPHTDPRPVAGGKPRSTPRKPTPRSASPEPVNQVVSRNCQGSPETTPELMPGFGNDLVYLLRDPGRPGQSLQFRRAGDIRICRDECIDAGLDRCIREAARFSSI
jgi:hypothetical protein